MGAKVIEKHFTIDKKFSKFRDHTFSRLFRFKKFSFRNKKVESCN